MKRQPGMNLAAEEDVSLNISPLIDMVFILLIFFIVTTVFVDETGLGITNADPRPSTGEVLTLLVKRDGRVIADGDDVGLAGLVGWVRAKEEGANRPVIVNVAPDVPAAVLVQVLDRLKSAFPKVPVSLSEADE